MAENELTTEETGPANFAAEYIRLRTVLDSLELTSLRYCLNDPDEAERIARAKELQAALRQIINKFQDRPSSTPVAFGFMASAAGSGSGSGCPDGYFNCNGCCVPYPCP